MNPFSRSIRSFFRRQEAISPVRRLRLETMEDRLCPATTLTRYGSSTDILWSTPGNWRDSATANAALVAPTADDTLVFNGNHYHRDSTQDILSNVTIAEVIFNNSYKGTVTVPSSLKTNKLELNGLDFDNDKNKQVVAIAGDGVLYVASGGTFNWKAGAIAVCSTHVESKATATISLGGGTVAAGGFNNAGIVNLESTLTLEGASFFNVTGGKFQAARKGDAKVVGQANMPPSNFTVAAGSTFDLDANVLIDSTVDITISGTITQSSQARTLTIEGSSW